MKPRTPPNRGPVGRGELRNFRLTVAYDGGRYRGFEIQPGQATVRGAIERALKEATGELIRIHVGGRTDAGVHATGQVVSFHARCPLHPDAFRKRVSDLLPDDVAVRSVEVVERGFHARHSAIARRYRYQLTTEKSPLLRHQAWWIRARLDVDLMRQAAAPLEGRHDFAAFGDVAKEEPTELTLQEWGIVQEPPIVAIELLAERFLWRMVRRVVGSLVAVGRGELPPSIVADALAKPRGEAAAALRPHTAPPQGLILVRVIYPGDLKPQAAKLDPIHES